MDHILECKDITKSFGSVTVVQNMSFSLEPGEIVSLLGPSGCGKTTVLRLIAGFLSPDQGEIEIGGSTVYKNNKGVPPEKRGVGLVFQDYALFPHLSVLKNITFGLKDGDKEKIASKYISLLGLEGLESRMPGELSGGQQQRVALARALAPSPKVLLLDEPFSNLDASLRLDVREEILDILKSNGVSAIFVTHDQEEAFFVGDKIAIMNNGYLEQLGSPYEIYHNPKSSFIAKFVGTADFISVSNVSDHASTIVGDVDLPNRTNDSNELEIMVRPDDIELHTDTQRFNATIVSSIFQGGSYIYKVSMDSGETLHCLEHHAVQIPLGSRVLVSMSNHHKPLFFHNGIQL
ncbi:MAG: ABC transporter ATP-binding protein [Thermodesulfobacteriota bacterium]